MIKNLTFIFLLCVTLHSCSVLDRDEPVPAFLSIEEFSLNTTSNQGDTGTNITEVKVTVDGASIGLFELPAKVPVISTGAQNIILSPIVKQDGISTTRVVYPFYRGYSTTEVLTPLETLLIDPEITYFEDLDFWVEEFVNSINFNTDDLSQGELVLASDELSFEGNGSSAMVSMDDDGVFFRTQTEEEFEWPLGQPVFLEMNYSCNHPFFVGASANTGSGILRANLVGIVPTTENDNQNWKKIYINLTDFVANNGNAQFYEVYFTFSKNDNYPEPAIFLDNLKVIH